ncbi:MAG: hypothetical protein Q9187_007291 [Circinaria calcarea]
MEAYPLPQDESPLEVPPLMNPPPQVFGSLTPGSPSAATYSGAFFGGEDQNGGNLDESNDAKRRRIARACDMCRKKKIKCDGKMPACSHCINYKTECIFTQVEKKRNPPKGAKYIEGLENRLGRMESLLKLSGLLNEEDDRTDLGTLEKRLVDKSQSFSNGGTPAKSPRGSESASQPRLSTDSPRETPVQERGPSQRSSVASPEVQKEGEEEVEALSDMMCSLVTNHCGETRYIGSSSGFSIFSPKGIQWVNEKTGDKSFEQMVATGAGRCNSVNKWNNDWKPEVFGDLFDRRTFTPLPPLPEALSLLKDFFENFNYPFDGSGWWASLNVALAIAHRLRVVSNLVSRDEDNKAWGLLKNALGVLTELTMRSGDLLSVQALLGMALFLQGTPNPQPSFFLVSAAIRLAHSIGLHKRGSGFGLTPLEVEQRKRVFWIAYMLDKDICLRSGRPPAQDDDDMNVDLPSEDPGDNVGNIPLANGKGKTNLFRLMCTFSIIESRVYKQLYSSKASKQSDGELLNTIGELDRELEEWKDAIPLDFRPEHEIRATHTPLLLHVVVLHFAYYNCLTTIHRMSVHHGYWTSRLSNYAIKGLNARPLNPRVFLSAALCVQAARASIHLVKYVPQGDFACVWMILYFPVSALVTLFANILQNPQDTRARSDIYLMSKVVNFLEIVGGAEESGGVKHMLAVCAEFERIAKVVLDKADKESHSRRKRKINKDDEDLVPQQTYGKRPLPARTPEPSSASTPASLLTPCFNGNLDTPSFNPSLNGFPSPNSTGDSNSNSNSNEPPLPDYMAGLGDFPNMMTASNGFTDFGDFPTFGNGGVGSPLDLGSYQQPFVPQDLWQMPMTLEWDWADMTVGAQFANMDGGGDMGVNVNVNGIPPNMNAAQQHSQFQSPPSANGL